MVEYFRDFSQPLNVKIEGNSFVLIDGFCFKLKNSSFEYADEVISVPKNFFYTPSKKIFKSSNYGDTLKIHILHSYLYYIADTYKSKYNFSKKEADKILLEAILENKVWSKPRAYAFYFYLRCKDTFFSLINKAVK